MFVPNEASVQMKPKVFNIFCLWKKLVVDINSGAGFSAVCEGDMCGFRSIWFQSPKKNKNCAASRIVLPSASAPFVCADVSALCFRGLLCRLQRTVPQNVEHF
jgi:hypothetical protein